LVSVGKAHTRANKIIRRVLFAGTAPGNSKDVLVDFSSSPIPLAKPASNGTDAYGNVFGKLWPGP